MIIEDRAPTLGEIADPKKYNMPMGELLGDYPIWDETKRTWLNERILDHFRFREIAQDTPAQFAAFASRKMREVMPTMNPMFQALESVDDASVTSWTRQRSLASTTPQTQLSSTEQYADALQDVDVQSGTNTAQALSSWYRNANNALVLLFGNLEPLFYQIWE